MRCGSRQRRLAPGKFAYRSTVSTPAKGADSIINFAHVTQIFSRDHWGFGKKKAIKSRPNWMRRKPSKAIPLDCSFVEYQQKQCSYSQYRVCKTAKPYTSLPSQYLELIGEICLQCDVMGDENQMRAPNTSETLDFYSRITNGYNQKCRRKNALGMPYAPEPTVW